MNTPTDAVAKRVSPQSFWVPIGDIALIGLFVLAGELSHFSTDYLLANPDQVLDTALPFYLGWGIAAIALGAYSPTANVTPKRALAVTGASWISAALIGQGLRSTRLFHGDFAVTFLFVSIGVGLVLLVPWRIAISIQ